MTDSENAIHPNRDSKTVLQVLFMLLGSQLAFQMCKKKEASLFSTSDRIFLTSSHPARKLMEVKGEDQQV